MTDTLGTQNAILDTANTLFQAQGFDTISLSDIATHAHIPLDTIARDYSSTTQIALHIYNRLSQQSLETAQDIAPAALSEQYYTLLEQRLTSLEAHSEAVSILFATAMRPSASITASDLSSGKSDPMMHAMQFIVDTSSDKFTRDSDEMVLFLYAFHFLVIIFWLYDRSDDKAASHMFTHFIRDFIKAIRPMMVMPFVIKALRNVSQIMLVVFGGAHIVESTPENP